MLIQQFPCRTTERTRSVTTATRHGGYACPYLEETRNCNAHTCAVHCAVSAFSAWTTCTKSCGTGSQNRSAPCKAAQTRLVAWQADFKARNGRKPSQSDFEADDEGRRLVGKAARTRAAFKAVALASKS